MANLVGQQFGNYRLVKWLGKGGFAEVYLGEHILLRTPAAIKVLNGLTSPQDENEFLNEARIIFNLKHMNIIRLLEFGVAAKTPFMAMEYAPKGTLRSNHPYGTRLSLSTVVSYVKPIADALQYAHNSRLIHRDVKPENMLVGAKGEIMLGDFGIALIIKNVLTQTTQPIVGTFLYMAPEQFKGKPLPASDQYALSCVVYEWLCGDFVFNSTGAVLIAQHLSDLPEPLHNKVPTIPATVEQVVFKALAKDPQQRFASVQEFASALEQASDPKGTINFAQQATVYPPPLARTIPAKLPTHGKLLLTCHSQMSSIATVAWSQSGQYLSLHNNDSIEIWDTTDGSIIFSYEKQPRSRYPLTAEWSPYEQIIAIGKPDGSFLLWDAELRSQLWTWTPDLKVKKPYPDGTIEFHWLADKKYLMTIYLFGTSVDCYIWDMAKEMSIFDKYFTTTADKTIIRFSPNGVQAGSMIDRNTIQIWDIATKGINFSYHQPDILDLAWADDGRYLICVAEKGISICDTYVGHQINIVSLEWGLTLRLSAWSPNRTIIAFIVEQVGFGNGQNKKWMIEIWNLMTHQKLRSIAIAYYGSLRWSPDMQHIFLYKEYRAFKEYGVEVWDISSNKMVSSYEFPIFALSPDGTLIATSSNDKTLQIWEVTNHNHLFPYPGYAGRIKSITWAPDGNRLAIVLDDSTIQILQVQ